MEIILMLRSRLLVVALCSFLMLAACQNPRPETSPLEPEPVPFTSPVLPPDSLSGGWQTWRAGVQPDAVNTVVISGGTLWAGTSSGVARLDLQTGTYNRYEDMGKTYRVLPIEDGQAFAASVKGLFYFSDEQWRKLEFPELFSYYSTGIYILALDRAGNLWLQGSGSRSVFFAHFQGHTPPASGVWRDVGDQSWPTMGGDWANCDVWRSFTDGSRYSYLSPGQCLRLRAARAQLFNSLPPRDRDLTLIAIDGDKNLWWAYSNTLARVTDSQTITFELPFANAYAYSLAADPAHGVWVATAQGLFYSDGVTLQQPLLELNSRTFRGTPLDIAVDAHGTVWVNTLEGGEVRALATDPPKWNHVKNGDSNVIGIRSLTPSPDGGFWATRGWDLWKSDDPFSIHRVTVPNAPCGLSDLAVDPAGNVWSPAQDCGALEFNLKADQWLSHKPDTRIEAVTIGKSGPVYVLGPTGVYAFTGTDTTTSWHKVISNTDKGQNLTIAADDRGGVWIASRDSGQLWYYANDHETSFGQPFKPHALVMLYATDQPQAIEQGELALFNGQTWKRVTLPNIGTVSHLTGGPDGRLWVAGAGGIAVYDPARDSTR